MASIDDGDGNAVQDRGCPRNCMRTAHANMPLERSGKAAPGADAQARRPAVIHVDTGRSRAGCTGGMQEQLRLFVPSPVAT